jgi:hypothetical protein
MLLVQFVFGWPMIVASVALSVGGIVLRSWRVAVAGAVAALPFMFYIFANPLGRGIAPPVVCAHFGCAYALHRRRALVAAILVAPYVALAAWVVIQLGRQ